MSIILISGGTGLIGKQLTKHLVERGHEVIILSRKKNIVSPNPQVSYSYWNVEKKVIDREVVIKADHIIHLAGAGVMDKKWTEEYKRKILESRTKSAELIISCLKDNDHHTKSFVSASAIGWYGPDRIPLEREGGYVESDLPANDFLASTCVLWEAAVDAAIPLGIRLVKLRTGIVLSNNGGAFKEFKKPLRFGIATIFGNGKQVLSWIHIDDLCRMYCEAIENNYMNGSYNAVAPGPLQQRNLEILIAEKLKNKFFIPIYIPSFFLKLILGKRSIEILKSTTVSNKKVKSTGFTFLYPSIDSAVDDLLKKRDKSTFSKEVIPKLFTIL